ncbi:hypothetical protein HYDPIDRAFT_93406 [Hydnomerulius pinastri MD-312]|uniref:Unplaced genomic scaffold scaffold_19, whole genome shotgun sequence n=1 Tax=Hydnomerulius pinastri MD-312 TaxID=994086 RepID=A0A0C9WDW8_9AGAM|nr:hypothetical protein HYDPIDRAFT_93406 [Hydnomerulius pinastri MD-312]
MQVQGARKYHQGNPCCTSSQILHKVGVPRTFFYGQEGEYSVLVTELLGPSLEYLLNLCGGTFSLKTVCLVAKQIIARLQSIHELSFIHRYIRPSSLLIADPRSAPQVPNQIYIVAFGFTRVYRSKRTGFHYPPRATDIVADDTMYASTNSHRQGDQSRRDDLEALGYVLAHFLRGDLPWDDTGTDTELGDAKENSLSTLYGGFPAQFGTYMAHARGMNFADSPNYDYLRGLFDEVLRESSEADDGVYDWMLLNDGKGWNIVSPSWVHSAASSRFMTLVAERRCSYSTRSRISRGFP